MKRTARRFTGMFIKLTYSCKFSAYENALDHVTRLAQNIANLFMPHLLTSFALRLQNKNIQLHSY